ncbi:hypothetical protein [Saccharopolyspora hordei]|uniref:Uncharacterized protein n=2 Tax=Saccharopolyspora hordei TaxID=1838 RepID=A0A853AH04_9PSEU|nr:hypothetical protein [Saccharopolyspora hordei]
MPRVRDSGVVRMVVRAQRPAPRTRRPVDAAPESLTCALAATVLEETYRYLDETYAVLGLARWNQPPAEALQQARTLEPREDDAPERAPSGTAERGGRAAAPRAHDRLSRRPAPPTPRR